MRLLCSDILRAGQGILELKYYFVILLKSSFVVRKTGSCQYSEIKLLSNWTVEI